MLAKLVFQHLDIDTKYEKLLFVEQFTIDSVVCGMAYSIVYMYTFSLFAYSWRRTSSICMSSSRHSKSSTITARFMISLTTIFWLANVRRAVISSCCSWATSKCLCQITSAWMQSLQLHRQQSSSGRMVAFWSGLCSALWSRAVLSCGMYRC